MTHRGRGLPHRWWKDWVVWLDIVCLVILLTALTLTTLAWFLDWKP